jgi:hypothetical protein
MDKEWQNFTAPIRFITNLLALFSIEVLVLAFLRLYAVVALRSGETNSRWIDVRRSTAHLSHRRSSKLAGVLLLSDNRAR